MRNQGKGKEGELWEIQMQNCEVEIKEDAYFSKSDETDGYKL